MRRGEDRRPVLVGVAQLVQRDALPARALTPLAMLERTVREAFVVVENVGRPGRVRAVDGQNLFRPD
jgi:hypothetical protein